MGPLRSQAEKPGCRSLFCSEIDLVVRPEAGVPPDRFEDAQLPETSVKIVQGFLKRALICTIGCAFEPANPSEQPAKAVPIQLVGLGRVQGVLAGGQFGEALDFGPAAQGES